MDIDFPLVLVVLVFGSGLIWLADHLLLAPKRWHALEQLRSDYPGWENESSSQFREYQKRSAVVGTEPVLVEYAKSFFPVLFVVFVLRSFLVEPFQIPSSSMVPTLQVGDYILVNKYTYGVRLPVLRTKVLELNQPQRGDVMVFFPPHLNDTYFINAYAFRSRSRPCASSPRCRRRRAPRAPISSPRWCISRPRCRIARAPPAAWARGARARAW